MAGNRTPTALKEVRGSYKKHPERRPNDEPVPERGIGPCPDWLDDDHRAIWDELVGNMYAGVMGEADRTSMETLVRLVYKMRTDFDSMNAAQLGRMIALLGLFGMTPADRSKVSTTAKKKTNTFEGL